MSDFYDFGKDPVAIAINDALNEDARPNELRNAANAARDACVREILAHMDEHAPLNGNTAQRRLRRHLSIAVQVISPKPTVEEIIDALRQYEG